MWRAVAIVASLGIAGTAAADSELPGNPFRDTPLEQALVAEINRVRADPRAYAKRLIERRRYFDGKLWNLPDRDPLRTKEGAAALDDAVRALRRAKRSRALVFDRLMASAARDHVADIGPRGVLSHEGVDGSLPFSRLARYGLVIGTGSENIGVAFTDAELFVIHQLVDDGVKDRGHRKNILDRRFRRIGVACGPHKKYNVVCVMDFAEAFRPPVSAR